MNVLVVVNNQAYGSRRSRNALRRATALGKRREVEVRVLRIADAVACGVASQRLPDDHRRLDRISTDGCTARWPAAAARAGTPAASAMSASATARAARRSRS